MFGYFLVFGSRDVEVNVESYDAQMLLSQLISEHVLLMSDSGYTVEENVSELSLVATLDTDVQKLVRIIDNVFSNIYKYADQKKTVKIEASADACQIKLAFSNSIASERELVESNGIGLKTCKKLAELIGAKFFSETLENKFYANITLPITIK
jgi:signal transduction histidine kinase